MFQFPGFALIPLWIQGVSTFIYDLLPLNANSEPPIAPGVAPIRHSPFRHFALIDNRSQKVGCPIRKFPDQSLFAAPRDLSQRTTSFIASQRQGIRQIPFWHLIHARNQKTDGSAGSRPQRQTSSDRKDQFCFKHIRDLCGQAKITTGMLSKQAQPTVSGQGLAPSPNPIRRLLPRPDALPLHDVNVGAANPKGGPPPPSRTDAPAGRRRRGRDLRSSN
jgi:hypothetical protein